MASGDSGEGNGAGNTQPFELPVADSQAQASQETQDLFGEGATQEHLGGAAPPLAASDEEADLFGDGDEEPPAAASSQSTAPAPDGGGQLVAVEQQAPAPADPGGGQIVPVEEEPAEKDLFGDDNEDADEKELFGDDGDLDEKALFGSDEEGGDIDEKELFGSDDEAGTGTASALHHVPSALSSTAGPREPIPPTPEPSEMDPVEIFGPSFSDEEPEHTEEVTLSRRPQPEEDRIFMTLKLSNILSVEKQAFNGKNFTHSVRNGYTEQVDTTGKATVKLLSPDNCIRWRFKKGPEGNILTDEDGRPQYEANSRIVEWEDGSRTLFIGKNMFNVSEIKDDVVLFEENSADVHVCHGTVNSRLTVTPRSLVSDTHEMVKHAQYNKNVPLRRTVAISQEEQEQAQQIFELQNEQRKRQSINKRAIEGEGDGLTAAFLEGDDGGHGSIRDLKRKRT